MRACRAVLGPAGAAGTAGSGIRYRLLCHPP
jgi:hypothetical protein